MTAAVLEKNLQDLVAEEARRCIGEQWPGQCGDFVREVLASRGVVVQGHLRDFGIRTTLKQKKPGDILLFYANPIDYKEQRPFHAAILSGPDKLVGKKGSDVVERSIEFCMREGLPYGITTISIYHSNIIGYVRIRRIP